MSEMPPKPQNLDRSIPYEEADKKVVLTPEDAQAMKEELVAEKKSTEPSAEAQTPKKFEVKSDDGVVTKSFTVGEQVKYQTTKGKEMNCEIVGHSADNPPGLILKDAATGKQFAINAKAVFDRVTPEEAKQAEQAAELPKVIVDQTLYDTPDTDLSENEEADIEASLKKFDEHPVDDLEQDANQQAIDEARQEILDSYAMTPEQAAAEAKAADLAKDQADNAVVEAKENLRKAREIQAEGFDKAADTGVIRKQGRVERGAAAVADAIATVADAGTKRVTRGRMVGDISGDEWTAEYANTTSMSSEDVAEANKQADALRQAERDQDIVNAGFDEEAVNKKLAKQQKKGFWSRLFGKK